MLNYVLLRYFKGEIVRKIQVQVISIITIILIGITMFSMANATSPAENQAAGVAFLAENAKKANVVKTDVLKVIKI